MRARRSFVRLFALAAVFSILAVACSSGDDSGGNGSASGSGDCTPPETPVITFAAYSTPREVYGKIISVFQSFTDGYVLGRAGGSGSVGGTMDSLLLYTVYLLHISHR